MVFFFKSTVVDPPAILYMGRDKFENEDLLKWGVDEDVWFHVDDLSSAHVYLKLQPGWTVDTIPEAVLTDCCQLVKANSIEGNKKNNLKIIYTPWKNLLKLPSHDVGAISFHSMKRCKFVTVEKRVNEIVNRLNKTKEERTVDWQAERIKWEQEQRRKKRIEEEQARKEAAIRMEEEKRRKDILHYKDIFTDDNRGSQGQKETKTIQELEDDFFG